MHNMCGRESKFKNSFIQLVIVEDLRTFLVETKELLDYKYATLLKLLFKEIGVLKHLK